MFSASWHFNDNFICTYCYIKWNKQMGKWLSSTASKGKIKLKQKCTAKGSLSKALCSIVPFHWICLFIQWIRNRTRRRESAREKSTSSKWRWIRNSDVEMNLLHVKQLPLHTWRVSVNESSLNVSHHMWTIFVPKSKISIWDVQALFVHIYTSHYFSVFCQVFGFVRSYFIIFDSLSCPIND